MNKVISIIVCLAMTAASAQTYKQQEFQETVHGLTSIINVVKSDGVATYGTGFFYHKYLNRPNSIDSILNAVDSSLQSIWLVTNKHVVFGSANFERALPQFPKVLEFFLRKRIVNRDRPIWDTIRLEASDLKTSIRLHADSTIDVVAIDVTKFVLTRLEKRDSLYFYGAVSRANFPNADLPITLQGFPITIGQEILSVGYPRNFYDRYNLFPTVKSGIVASKWNAKFNGRPYFLIDAKLFPGSSGSAIITKSTNYGVDKGGYVDYFNFLGIYSGEPFQHSRPVELEDMTIIRKETYGIGIVWYYWIIEELIR